MNSGDQRRPTVLAIDDDPNILEIIKTHLETEGFRVETHAHPAQALQWYSTYWPQVDLILLDYAMPELNGEAVFEQVRRVNPQARVLLVTAYGDAVAKKLFQQGLRGYIPKPFYLNQLSRAVRAALLSP